MDFNGALGKEGSGIGVWIQSPMNQSSKLPPMSSYKFSFNFSNNGAIYEALVVGLKILKKLGAKKISVYGDSKLIMKKVKGEYQDKNPSIEGSIMIQFLIRAMYLVNQSGDYLCMRCDVGTPTFCTASGFSLSASVVYFMPFLMSGSA